MALKTPKEIALNHVYNDINVFGYVKTFVYLSKGTRAYSECLEDAKESTDDLLRLIGKTAREMGAERVYLFFAFLFNDATLPQPVPLDDKNKAVHIFDFDMTDGENVKAKRSYIPYKKPGKILTISQEMYLTMDKEEDNNMIFLFVEGYNSTVEKEG